MARWMLVWAVVLLAGCNRTETGMSLLSATPSPTAGMVASLTLVQQACPDLIGNRERYLVHQAVEGPASLSAEREFGAKTTTRLHVEIVEPVAGSPYDVGEHCYYEVAQKRPGVLVSKTACTRLCGRDGNYQAIAL